MKKTDQVKLHSLGVRGAGVLRGVGSIFGRSLFPLAAIAIVGSTMIWGPWWMLLTAFLWWNVVTRVA